MRKRRCAEQNVLRLYVVIVVAEKDADEIFQQLNQLEVQLTAFQSEFATKYVLCDFYVGSAVLYYSINQSKYTYKYTVLFNQSNIHLCNAYLKSLMCYCDADCQDFQNKSVFN